MQVKVILKGDFLLLYAIFIKKILLISCNTGIVISNKLTPENAPLKGLFFKGK